MLQTVNELIKEIEGVEKYLMGMFELSDLADEETMKLIQNYAKLMKLSKNLMVEQAEAIDNMKNTLYEINSKLDRVLMK